MPPFTTTAVPDRVASGESQLERDSIALHRSLAELIRIVQFRDRDRICCHDVTVSQCYALEAVVHAGPLTVNELAARLYLEKSTASRLVEALVERGYVARGTHPADGRAVLLEATAPGRRLYGRIEEALVQESRRVLLDMDPDLRAAAVSLLGRIVRAAADRIERGGGSCSLRG